MGRRGPAPQPTALKLINGQFRTDRGSQNEPVPRSALPQPPDSMGGDARAIWDYTVRELEVMKIASSADRESLACYCEAVVNHRRASLVLSKSDILIKGIHGNPVRNPALAVQRDAAQVIRQFAQEFGLTPSARTRIEHYGDSNYGEENPFAGTA